VYLEDYISIKQKAQQLKLASMGKLAARIAHEIRNPLGAISHASQLLSESDSLIPDDHRMTEIIENNSKRINAIVDSTMEISRRREPQSEEISLGVWIDNFINDYQGEYKSDIKLDQRASNLLIKFDQTHLQQILTNLIENAGRHGQQLDKSSKIEIETGKIGNDNRAYLAVKDSGAGIPANKIDDIFEPFFTTHQKGTGLGLYICKELVEINHANLLYERQEHKTVFRIEFSHHLRMR
jgi:two-component system sensor histidine kinase PilS (NtrC family)